MRIISQSFADFPYDKIVIFVDDNMVCCGTANDWMGKHSILGEYESNERAVEVFRDINKAFYNIPLMDGDGCFYNQTTFVMPEE